MTAQRKKAYAALARERANMANQLTGCHGDQLGGRTIQR